MKKLVALILILNLFSCTSEKENKESVKPINKKDSISKPNLSNQLNSEVEVPIETPKKIIESTEYQDLNSTIREDILKLDNIYASTPFFTNIGDSTYYIICDGKWNYKIKRFSDGLKYGIADDSLNIISPPIYDKIYNPNLTIQGCFEVKIGSKIGLINYKTNESLEPIFDYILPSSSQSSNIGYGYKLGKWFEIDSKQLSNYQEIDFDPYKVLKNLSFNILNINENMMYDSYYVYYENDGNQGRGVVINPSYVEHLNLLSSHYYDDIILTDQKDIHFGTEKAIFKMNGEKNVSDNIISLFVSIYEEGIGGRGYQIESNKLMVYNKQTRLIQSASLVTLNESDYFCREAEYKFVNDSIIEIKSNKNPFDEVEKLYKIETKYNYLKILPDGEIVKLNSNRHFDFTKFIKINKNHFNGCFAKDMEEHELYDTDDFNIWKTEHLSIEDLDIMRNEIFADYGYIFKTEKWKSYFSKKPWYKPEFDNVDDKLTELEKDNIKIILEVKASMKGKEKAFTKKQESTYYVAG